MNVKFLSPKKHYDDRGYFSETWNSSCLAQQGILVDFVQDNQSVSIKAGTVRGLHFQAPPFAQAKLVRCSKGSIFDVAVDIRIGSPTFGKWVGKRLSADNSLQAFIPEGYMHGFVTLEPNSEVLYKCSSYYRRSSEITVKFDAPCLNISWPLTSDDVLISEKDSEGMAFKDLNSPFVFGEY